MKKIKKISKKSLAKLLAYFYGVTALLIGISFTVASVFDFYLRFGFETSGVLEVLTSGLFFSALILIAGLLFGWLDGYIIALFYNIFARNNGGLQVEIDDDNKGAVTKPRHG